MQLANFGIFHNSNPRILSLAEGALFFTLSPILAVTILDFISGSVCPGYSYKENHAVPGLSSPASFPYYNVFKVQPCLECFSVVSLLINALFFRCLILYQFISWIYELFLLLLIESSAILNIQGRFL